MLRQPLFRKAEAVIARAGVEEDKDNLIDETSCTGGNSTAFQSGVAL